MDREAFQATARGRLVDAGARDVEVIDREDLIGVRCTRAGARYELTHSVAGGNDVRRKVARDWTLIAIDHFARRAA